jgi:aminoglycoside phosphotransferase (APT) family kinase protein
MQEKDDQIQSDKTKLLKLAIEKITPHCNEDSEHELLRKIGARLKDGDRLLGTSLEGSTNHSFKVFLQRDPSLALFVKIALSYALWNPNREIKFGVDRETMEFNMMKRFAEPIGEDAPVAKPYLCFDINEDTRMLVCEFIESRLLAYQFVEGNVDRRVLPKIASFVAKLNLESCNDPKLNECIKDSYRSLYPIAKSVFGSIVTAVDEPDDDHFIVYAKEVGESRFSDVIDAMGAEYEKSECLLHGDMHSLNILVEPSTKDTFGEKGTFVLCDWEMSHAGVKGRDAGSFYAWPILSAYFLVARGLKKEAYNVFSCVEEFWDEYAKTLVGVGAKDENYLLESYRSSIGWCGVYLFIANYLLGAQKGAMPFHLISETAKSKVWASLGLTGLKCLEHAFLKVEPEATLEELRAWFAALISTQIELLSSMCK